jgi:pSer/pThr/pTyr-binding forkhead associated (FHA) protein
MIEDPTIDENHAEIINKQDQLTLLKKTSKGIIKVNGQIVSHDTKIKANDVITLGSVELELVDSQSLISKKVQSTKAAHIWSLHSNASWLEKNSFIINKKTTIGRDPSCDICLTLDYLSRQHVSLEPQNGKLFIEDLNSSNGTFVNGEKINKAELKPGDKIKLDVLTFEVRGPSEQSASDPNRTIIRTASSSPSTPKAVPTTSKPSENNPNPPKQPKQNSKSNPARKRLASEGKQAWISGDNQLKAKAEKKKGGGVIFTVLALSIVAAGLVFVLTQ